MGTAASASHTPTPSSGPALAAVGSRLAGLLRRPELGAVAGAIGVYVFFVAVAGEPFYSSAGTGNWLSQAAELGIVAVPVAMLMIAGEFDLSVGSMLGAATMIIAVTNGVYGWPIELGIAAAFGVAIVVGLINGYVVVRTGLPSFIVTLAQLFILRGVTIGLTSVLTGATNVALQNGRGAVHDVLASQSGSFSIEILWWLAIIAVATWVLIDTRFGNWTYGTGGDSLAARNVGVPVDRVRIVLFVCSACAATLVAVMQVLSVGSGDVLRGTGLEFQAIIAAVIGGCLLTGGYGSAIGAAFGALTFGMASLGINFAGWNTDWFQAFLGTMLLLAVLANTAIRKKALGAR
jgi:simple sugar transport system permease protein